MATFNEPDLLEEDFPIETKQVHQPSEDREELDNQATSLQTKLAELNRAREKLEREKATVEESRRRFSEFETGREEMMHEITRSLGLLEESQMDAQREAEQLTRTMDDLRDAFSKVEMLEDVDTHDEQWKVILTRNLTTIENARMELNSARLKWPLIDGESKDFPNAFVSNPSTNSIEMVPPKSFGELCLWGLALTWPILLIGAGIIAILLAKG